MRGLIFDYDGLMVDSEAVAATTLIDLLAEREIAVGLPDFEPFVGSTGLSADRAWRRWIGELLGPDHVDEFNVELWRRIDEALTRIELKEGVVEVIEAARRGGWRIGIGSGQVRARLERGLRRLEVLDRFDAIVTAADVGIGKPAPDIFLEVARRMGVSPRDCIVLEDSAPGCAAAVAAGMKAIACPSVVTASSVFPGQALRVTALTELRLSDL